jgi:sugar phosphate isomerase/epimerase
MKLTLIRHLWGYEKSLAATIGHLKSLGYEGIETPLGNAQADPDFMPRLRDHSMRYIGMAFTGGNNAAEHFDSMRQQVDALVKLGASQVTIHSARDAFSLREAESFYAKATEYEKGLPIVVGHETHRGRAFYNPWTTRDLLAKFPSIKLCIDYSHWVCVAERLLDDCGDILATCAQRCVHLHARVGFEQGPQVPDPSAPEYATHLAAHEKWWKQIFAARGNAELTCTPEFGPPGYMHTLPHTNVPVANLESVCDWIALRVQALAK